MELPSASYRAAALGVDWATIGQAAWNVLSTPAPAQQPVIVTAPTSGGNNILPVALAVGCVIVGAVLLKKKRR